MKKVLFLILLISCNMQKNNKMEKFDVTLLSDSLKTKEIINQGENKIKKIGENENNYFEINYYLDSPYVDKKSFSKKSLLLKSTGKYFYGVPIGIHIEYDEKGKIIKEKDMGKSLKFSPESLIKKVKDNYKIDLLNPKDKGIIVGALNKVPVYEITLQEKNKFNSPLRIIKISAIDGTVISDDEVNYKK